MLLLVAAILSCAAAAWTWPWLRMCWKARSLPGPSFWWLLSSMQEYLRGPEHAFNLLGRMFEQYGPALKLWFGPELVLMVASAPDAERVLVGPEVAGRGFLFRRAVGGIIGVNIFTSQGEIARARRRLVAPAFHAARLSDYVTDFARNADRMCARIATMADGRTVDMKDQLSVCTLAAICETVIGVRMTYDPWFWVSARDQLELGMKLVARRVRYPWLLIDWIYSGATETRLVKTFTDIFHDAVAQQRATPQKPTPPPLLPHRHKPRSFLDAALASDGHHPSFTMTETREEFIGLVAAGTDTSANVMAHTLMLLAVHPEYQQRVYDELRDIFDGSLRAATSDDLARMSTLEIVVKETLRLFPAAPFIPRNNPVDIVLASGDLLPAGASAYVSCYHLHRNPDHFVEPDRFWPERWLPENSVGRHAFAYLPFGAGARKCVGYKYAMLQMKVTLGRVLREFRVECLHSMRDLQRIEFGITSVSAVGYGVQMFAR